MQKHGHIKKSGLAPMPPVSLLCHPQSHIMHARLLSSFGELGNPAGMLRRGRISRPRELRCARGLVGSFDIWISFPNFQFTVRPIKVLLYCFFAQLGSETL